MDRVACVQRLLLACLAAFHASAGMAAGDGFEPSWNLSIGRGTTFLEPEGASAGFSATGKDQSGGKITLGRQLEPHWGWELSYIDAGDAPLSNPNPAIQDASVSYEIAAAFAAYSFGDPGSTFRLTGKLGASFISNEVSDSRVDISKDNSVQAAFGAGLEMRLSRRWFLKAEYESYASDAAYAGLRLGFRFGGGSSGRRSVGTDGRAGERISAAGIARSKPTVVEYPLYGAEAQAAVIREGREVVTELAGELSRISEQRGAASLSRQADTLTHASHRMRLVEQSILQAREIEDYSRIDPDTFVNDRGEHLFPTPAEQASELDIVRRDINQVDRSIGDQPVIRARLRRVDELLAVVSSSLLSVPPWERSAAERLCNELKMLEKTIQFHSESTHLTVEAQRYLDTIAQLLQRHPRIVLVVHAHTDSLGTEAFNQRLSEYRAEVVRQYLTQQGVAEARLTDVGYGESRPVATNETSEGRRQNRRVEFVVSNPNVCR